MTPMQPLPMADLCGGCGRCCASIGLPPFHAANPDLGRQPVDLTSAAGWEWDAAVADTELFLRMPAAVRAGHAALLRRLTGDPTGSPCGWLDPATLRCRHYDWRPTVCRDFTAGDPDCCTTRAGGADVMVAWREGASAADWRNPQRPGAARGTPS